MRVSIENFTYKAEIHIEEVIKRTGRKIYLDEEGKVVGASCNKCENTLTAESFSKTSSNKTGIETLCKECKSKGRRNYYENNSELEKDRYKEYYTQNKESIQEYKREYRRRNQ